MRFFKEQFLIGLNVLFYLLLFQGVSTIYNALTERNTSNLTNITEEQAVNIEAVVQDQLNNPVVSAKLQRSFVFFYLDNYQKRVFFTAKEGVSVKQEVQEIAGDPFYELMLNYHFNDICLVRETININPNSVVYTRFKETGELKPAFYYVSCPIYINDELVGYIGGINNNEEGSISVETSTVRNTATNIEEILNN